MNRKYTNAQFIDAIKNSNSISEALIKLGLCYAGSNHKTAKKLIIELNIDISHMKRKSKAYNKIPTKEILVDNSTYCSSKLKKRLVNEGILKNECHICKIFLWLGKEMPLELDHINGNSSDNRIENLRILCPNCHSQTETYRGKNIKKEEKTYLCKDCGKTINKYSTRCISCEMKNRETPTKIIWPEIEALKEMVKNSSLSSVAKLLGVSDTSVKKRIKRKS